jgi:hypothetical protein
MNTHAVITTIHEKHTDQGVKGFLQEATNASGFVPAAADSEATPAVERGELGRSVFRSKNGSDASSRRRAWKDGDIEVSDQCKACGKDIALLPANDALCCACRYGPGAAIGYVNHKAEMDCVEWMASHVGYRLGAGMVRFVIENS